MTDEPTLDQSRTDARIDRGPAFDGATYEPARDHDRLAGQLHAVLVLMKDGTWRRLQEISRQTGAPEASISARLRDLRKDKFGAYQVDRKYLALGLWQYRIRAPKPKTQRELF